MTRRQARPGPAPAPAGELYMNAGPLDRPSFSSLSALLLLLNIALPEAALTRSSVKTSDKLKTASRHRSGAAAETMGGGARGIGVFLWVLLAMELVLQPQCGMAMSEARGGPGAAARQLLQAPPVPCLRGLTGLQIPGFITALMGLLSEVGSQYGACLTPPVVETEVPPLGDPAACCSQAKANFVKQFPHCEGILCMIYNYPPVDGAFEGVDPGLVTCFATDACNVNVGLP